MFLTDAGGVGLNLQRAASACINLELAWNPAVLEQRIGRIYRLGQKRAIDVYNLVSEQGIEAHIATLVASKRALFDGLFDGTSDAVQYSGGASFLDGLGGLLADGTAPDGSGGDGANGAEDDPESVGDDELDRWDDAAALDDEDAGVHDAAADGMDANAPASGIRTGVGVARGVGMNDGEQTADSAVFPSSREINALFASLSVRRTPNGGVSIEAPPRAADAVMAAFENLARLMRGSAGG
jgi:hypothetical protein